ADRAHRSVPPRRSRGSVGARLGGAACPRRDRDGGVAGARRGAASAGPLGDRAGRDRIGRGARRRVSPGREPWAAAPAGGGGMIRRPILALDSSTAVGSVAVGGEEGVYAEVIQSVAGSHSASLLPAVEQVMRSAGLRPRDLAAVVVGEGPGSFTGLRIAGATAKGMLRGLDIPLYAYSGLLATAASAWSHEGPVWALFDARRRDVFA